MGRKRKRKSGQSKPPGVAGYSNSVESLAAELAPLRQLVPPTTTTDRDSRDTTEAGGSAAVQSPKRDG
jgi:hypothetical protein